MRAWLSTTRIVLLALLVMSCSVGCQRRAATKVKPTTGAAPKSATRNSEKIFPLSIIQVSSESSEIEKPPVAEAKTNRLAKETSPYLLLHAHNPVDWYAWGPEAFEAAKRENKPIFLSIGYSSCYWCHVMERLVFSKPEIAKLMNEQFINIKVDREERPDIDDIYMTALQVYLTLSGAGGSGGWPLSMFLTPDGQPVAGGTYFPPEDNGPAPGFPKVCKLVSDAWRDRHDEMIRNASTLTDVVQKQMRPAFALEKVELNRDLVLAATRSLEQSHDAEFGGVDFSFDRPNAPKFPQPTKLALLQYEAVQHQDQQASRVVLHTLDIMQAGGIRDHLGGGFHRYATDREWRLPHFEKMLYDNAQLLELFIDAHRATNKSHYREAADEIVGFLFAEMQNAQGGFYSAIDAETDSIEGKFYGWSAQEIDRVLGLDAPLFRRAYGVDGEPTFEQGFVLRLVSPVETLAVEERVPPRELSLKLFDLRRKLLMVRNERPKPLKDDKILTAWNGLAIRALAHAGALTNRKETLDAAERAAMFVLSNLRDSNGRLFRTYRAGQAKLNAYLDDYAFLIEGLLELHLVTRDAKWLNASRHLMDDQIKHFWDDQAHGFFYTSKEHEQLLTRFKDGADGALPSGNSVSVRNLIRLASLTGDNSYRDRAQQTLELFAPQMKKAPRSSSNLLLALSEFLDNRDYRLPTDRVKAAAEPNPKTPGPIEPTTGETPTPDTGVPPLGTPPKAARSEPPTEKTARANEVVSVSAFLSTTQLVPGLVTRLAVKMQIEPGWHINANPAGPKSAIPTVLTLKSKHGTQLKSISYPSGAAFGSAQVYEDNALIIGQLEVPAELAGQTEEIELQIRFQACNDETCLPPRTIKFATKVPVAVQADDAEETNAAIFAPEEKR
jgi:hypothetical protein